MTNKKLTFGSLFAGIGGFDIGFEQAGLTCKWQVEKEPFCQNVLKRHWPDVRRYEDVREVGSRNLEPVDVICGGFPCQDVSVAGGRAGLAGERSGLWFEFRRIIDELKPEWTIIENVPGLLSSNGGRDMGAIIGALAEFGYWWAYRVLDAQFFGVPQRRRRVFIVASLTRGCPQQVLFEPESSPWDIAPRRETGPQTTDTIGTSANKISGQQERLVITLYGGNKRKDRPEGGFYVKEEPMVKTLDTSGLNPNLHQGGVIIPDVNTFAIPLSQTSSNGGGIKTDRTTAIAFQQNTRDEVRLMNGDGQIAGALSAQPGMKQQNYIANTFNGYTGGAATLNSGGNNGGFRTEPGEHLIVWDNGQGDPNAEVRDVSYCLNGQANQGVGQANQGVRRLTPLECERLQGFPDGWTEEGQSDSARYRQLGNAVAVPVAKWIGEGLLKINNQINGDP